MDRAALILWVTATQRPDRESEAALLIRLRQRRAAHPERYPPTLLVAVSHLDRVPRAQFIPPRHNAALGV